MTRPDMDVQMQSALGESRVMAVPLVFLDILGDPLRAWGGIDTLNWDGHDWLGIGTLGDMSPIKADAKGSMPKMELSIKELPSELLAAAKETRYVGRTAQVWLGTFDEDLKLVGDPALFFAGAMSAFSILDAQSRSVTVTIDSRMALLNRVIPSYRSDEDQQRRHVGDGFFKFVSSVRAKTIYWSLKQASNASGYATGGGGSGGRDLGPYPELR